MASRAAIVRTMVGELGEDLRRVIAAPADRGLAEMAGIRPVDVAEMAGRPTSVTRATRRMARAVEDIVGEGIVGMRVPDHLRTARTVASLDHSLAELSSAVHRLP